MTVETYLPTLKIYFSGWRQFQVMIGARPEEIITVEEIIKGESDEKYQRLFSQYIFTYLLRYIPLTYSR